MSLLISMCVYSISMSVSPGPVNLVSFASGVSFGLRRTLPFVAGATIGFILLLLLVGVGLNQVSVLTDPRITQGMAVAACVFIGYMGVKIASADVELQSERQTPPHFASGFMFQWLNPKAWLASLAGVTAFDLTTDVSQFMVFVGIYFACCFPCVMLWALVGDKLGKVAKQRGYLKRINQLLGGVLITVAIYLLFKSLMG